MLACSSTKESKNRLPEMSEAQEVELKREFLKANREKVLGNNEKALESFRRCLLIYPNHAASLYEASRLEFFIGQSIVVINHLERAVEISPDNKWYKIELGEMYSSSGDYKKAAQVYQSLSEMFPYNLDYRRQIALMNLASGQLNAALKIYDEIEEIFGVNEEVSIQKQKIHLEQNNTKKAIAEMEKLIQELPTESKYLAILAELYKKDGDEKKAVEAFRRLEKINPNNPYVALSLSEYYSDAGDRENAYESLKKAFKSEELEIDTKIRYLLKYYAISAGDEVLQAQAKELNSIVIEVHPDDPKSYAMLGDFLYRYRKLVEARDAYQKALDKDQDGFAIWNQLILIDSELEDYEAILKHCSTAIDLFPNQPLFFYFKAIGHMQLKEYEDAVKVLDQGLPMAILNRDMAVQFHSSLGDSYYYLEQHEKSDAAYDAALELDDENVYVLNNYSYFLSLRKVKLDKAEKMIKKCLNKEPFSATYLDTYAWVLFQGAKYEEAKEQLEEALKNGGSDSGEILEHYGDVMFRLEDTEAALKYWNLAQGRGQDSEELKKKINSKSLD